MKFLISGVVVFALVVAGIWYLMSSKTPAPMNFDETPATSEAAPASASPTPAKVIGKIISAQTKVNTPEDRSGKRVLLKATRKQVGLSEESGGIGPTSFVTGHNGEVFFADRFNDRVIEITPDGKERVVYKSDPNEYIRGHGVDPSGNSFVLVGNDKYSLVKVSPEGVAQKLSFSHEPEHLDGMRVDAREDAVYLVGHEKTIRVDKQTGEKTEMYGVPSMTNDESLDVILTEEGRVMATFRKAATGAPDRTVEVGTQKYGSVLGTFPLEDGGFVMALASDPSLSEENAQNPKVTFQPISARGELGVATTIEAGITENTYDIDLPYTVTPTGVIQQAISDPSGTEVVEYNQE